MKPPAFQFYADDFLAGTADMTAEEVGVFIRLLCHSWSKDGIQNDDGRLMLMAGQCQASSLAHAKTKFSIVGDKLRNDRQEAEREKQTQFREKQSENGKKRWLGIAKPEPSLMPNVCSPSPSPSPKENNKVASLPAVDAFELHPDLNNDDFKASWGKWHEHLKQKRKPATVHARDLQLSKLGKMGSQRAIETINYCIEHNWQGIYDIPPTKADVRHKRDTSGSPGGRY